LNSRTSHPAPASVRCVTPGKTPPACLFLPVPPPLAAFDPPIDHVSPPSLPPNSRLALRRPFPKPRLPTALLECFFKGPEQRVGSPFEIVAASLPVGGRIQWRRPHRIGTGSPALLQTETLPPTTITWEGRGIGVRMTHHQPAGGVHQWPGSKWWNPRMQLAN
jgi:hypothetical protein